MTPIPLRTALYMPASNTRALAKAPSLDVDVAIFDLEDAVAPEARQQARENLVACLATDHGRTRLAARINSLETEWGMDDLRAVVPAGPHAIVVPKVSNATQLEQVCSEVAALDPSVKIWPMLETPAAVLNAGALSMAAAGRDGQVDCFVVGTNDLAKETGASAARERAMLLPWLSTMVACAKAAGARILDGPYNNFRDPDGLAAECSQGRAMGMDGKTLIHPAQIDVARRIFSPSEEELAWARSVVDAFARPENAHLGVISVDGAMVERLHLAVAEKTLAAAQD